MERFYERKDKKSFSRDSIIGLGEDSFRKNYYPELQEKVIILERAVAHNKALIAAIPDILLTCDQDGGMRLVSPENKKDSFSGLVM